MTNIESQSTITCPNCNSQSLETMPTDACQFFWKCPRCETTIRPKDGDCCVFFSYGDRACTPIQNDNGTASCC